MTKTLLLVEPNGQLMFTPSMDKIYSNQQYRIYRSTFEAHHQVILRKADGMCAVVEDYSDTTQSLNFEYKLNGSY